MKTKVRRCMLIAFTIILIMGCDSSAAHAATPAFVQVTAATPQTPQSSVSKAYATPQTAGNTNILAIGWNDTVRSISTVTDTKGNTYQIAVPTFRGNGLSQAVYYASNIAAGSNTVTVTFNGAASYVDLRISEYSGLVQSAPFDVGISASANNSSPNSGSATTTNANDLLFGAGMTALVFTGPGTNYTQRIITSQDGDITEDRIVTATSSYNAPAVLSGSGAWLMQMAAFKAASDVPPPAPVANFTGTPTTGTAPLAVQFTDTSTNAPTSWSWTFGDGGTSTVKNPSHTYVVAGTYSVALTATNAGGNNTNTKTNYIMVNSAPPPSGYPDATNTGVPAGTQLTIVNGDMTISTPNAVVDAKDIRGCVTVTATGVTLKNSKISCGGFEAVGYFDSGQLTDPGVNRFTIQDSEVDCQNVTGRTGIGDTAFNAYRVNVHGCENGFDVDQFVTIQDSFVHDLANSQSAHTDGIQLAHHLEGNTEINWARTVLVNYNTIQADSGTSAMISNPSGDHDITVQNNLISGGAYSLYCDYNATATNYQVISNRVSTRSYSTGGAFGPWTGCTDEAVVSDNRWYDGPNAGQLLQ